MTSSASDHNTTSGKSPAFQFYPADFTTGTVDLSTEEVGAYIRLLCYQWGKGSVPSDSQARARIAGLTARRMARVWTNVQRHFVEQADGSFQNGRLERVRLEQQEFRRRQSDAAARRWHMPKPSQDDAGAMPPHMPKASRTDALHSSSSVFTLRSAEKKQPPLAPDARSKRPIYQSDRFAVFEWQLDELSKMLGSHFEDFDLHGFFDGLSKQSRDSGLVIPKADVWPWLQAQVLAEVKRRKLPIASAEPVRDRKAEERAQDERILAQIQQERRLAGR